jgi:thiamine-phosphate pyrophosphorylase
MKRKQILRVLDANFNRTREGLRVCEEIARFFMEHKGLTRAFKKMRHAVTACLGRLPYRELLLARNSRQDVGRGPSALEKKRGGLHDLFFANAERAKESLRVLEEFAKLVDGRISDNLKKIRFDLYETERKSLPLVEALCHHGSQEACKPLSRGNGGKRTPGRGKRHSAAGQRG